MRTSASDMRSVPTPAARPETQIVSAKRQRTSDFAIDVTPSAGPEAGPVPYIDQANFKILFNSKELESDYVVHLHTSLANHSVRAIGIDRFSIENVYNNVSSGAHLKNHIFVYEYFDVGPSEWVEASFEMPNGVYMVGRPGFKYTVSGNVTIPTAYGAIANEFTEIGTHWWKALADAMNVSFSAEGVPLSCTESGFHKQSLVAFWRLATTVPGTQFRWKTRSELLGTDTKPFLPLSSVTAVAAPGEYLFSPIAPTCETIPYVTVQISLGPNDSLDMRDRDVVFPSVGTYSLHGDFLDVRQYEGKQQAHVQLPSPMRFPNSIAIKVLTPNGIVVPETMRWSAKVVFYH